VNLPFRRRHHSADAAHERALALAGELLLAPLGEAEASWLDAHLASCGECRATVDAYATDRALLRTLRDAPPVPPRDLWARTAAAIEGEAARDRGSRRAGRRASAAAGAAWVPPDADAARRRPRLGAGPLGALSGALVVLVVVGASLLSGPSPTPPPTGTVPAGSDAPNATPIAVTADGLAWVRRSDDGTYSVFTAPVQEVCPPDEAACAPLRDSIVATMTLRQEPQAVVISPSANELVVATADGISSAVLVIPVPSPTPEPTTEPSLSVEPSTPPSIEPSTPPSTPPSIVPSIEPSSEPSAPPSPSTGPTSSPEPTPEPTPEGATAIASAVILVGDPAYSADGAWFAFAARPADGPGGPDLYVWQVGTPLAIRMTTDGRTVFSGWTGGLVLASRVELEPGLMLTNDGLPAPDTSAAPSPSIEPGGEPSATPDLAGHFAKSFLVDPASGTIRSLGDRPMWRPSVDPTGRRVVFWEGLVTADESGGWRLGAGRLILDGWIPPTSPGPVNPSVEPSASPDPSATAGPAPGPAGEPVVILGLDAGATDFDARFDPTGTRLALWVADAADPLVGRLHLYVLDPASGAIDPDAAPLPGVPALRGFSIDAGRLAWVTPPGQDGEESRISVLAWRDDLFGRAESDPSGRFLIVH